MKLGDMTVRQVVHICRDHETCADCPLCEVPMDFMCGRLYEIKQSTLELEVNVC